MTKKILLGAVLAVVLAVLPASAGDDDEKGFFVGVELTSMTPSGGTQDYALLDPDDTNSVPEGVIQSVEHDSEINPRLHLGWANGNGGIWSLTWWEYDETANDAVSAASPSLLWDILYHADDAFESFQGTATAASNIDATLIDLAYSRPLTSSDKFSTRWHVGLRSAELGNALAVLYDDGSDTRTVLLTSNIEGFGLSGGISGMFNLTDKWFINGGTSYSMLTGDIDTLTFMDHDFSVDANIRGTKDATFSIFEARCSIGWHGPDWLYLWFGIEMSQWNNVVATNLFPDDVHDGFIQRDVTDVAWNGYTFGAAFKF